jgi:hypothetical protein
MWANLMNSDVLSGWAHEMKIAGVLKVLVWQ